MKILVTGGAGYIGSHACLEFLNAGHEVVVVDNLCNSSLESLSRVQEITDKDLVFYEVDLRDKSGLRRVFGENEFDFVVHFAGLKAVGESVERPILYYENNVLGSLNLFELMGEFGVKRIVFSSSATVYGVPERVPIDESFSLSQTNPYGRTKFMIEEILRDVFVSDNDWRIVILRYFNPVGAHESGRIGENPNGVPNNLMPYVAQVAVGKLPKLRIFGGDYETPDGTGVRDYIHVVDLAKGHLASFDKLFGGGGVFVYNLGRGEGISVLEMVRSFEKASGKKVSFEIVGRREGDVAKCYSDCSLAKKELGWVAEKGVDEMCGDLWKWQSNNPQGY